MIKRREFDLYLSEDSNEAHVCENYVPWAEECKWAKPDVHVREVLPGDENLVEALEVAKKALNKIGVLAKGEKAFTPDFTTEVEAIVREALELKDGFPY